MDYYTNSGQKWTTEEEEKVINEYNNLNLDINEIGSIIGEHQVVFQQDWILGKMIDILVEVMINILKQIYTKKFVLITVKGEKRSENVKKLK